MFDTTRAACRNTSPNLFFAPSKDATTTKARARVAHAKAICAQCPIRSECLEWAIEHRERNGIWGGLTEGERESLERRRTADRHLAVVK